MKSTVEEALKDLRAGKIVLVFDSDDRERETDMVVASEFVTPGVIMQMRKEAGGLICTAAHNDIKERFDLPFLVDVFSCSAKAHPVMDLLSPTDIPYDTKSAFSITINHRATFTGITDTDRALTISEFAKLAKRTKGMSTEQARAEFGRMFRAPGHVHLLNASKELLVTRFGHTELSTVLLVMTGLIPSATVCEMMGDDGHALSKEKAKEYAEKNDLCFLEGRQIIDSWKKWEKPK
ncbi:MAG TPA: 3,4-dihydroxy-2-butanone-4-phosphate synthase [Methanomassiliicoccales archaeon]|jgi:3,4-dihydroxy 2-butanone 4-phosphate synthase